MKEIKRGMTVKVKGLSALIELADSKGVDIAAGVMRVYCGRDVIVDVVCSDTQFTIEGCDFLFDSSMVTMLDNPQAAIGAYRKVGMVDVDFDHRGKVINGLLDVIDVKNSLIQELVNSKSRIINMSNGIIDGLCDVIDVEVDKSVDRINYIREQDLIVSEMTNGDKSTLQKQIELRDRLLKTFNVIVVDNE